MDFQYLRWILTNPTLSLVKIFLREFPLSMLCINYLMRPPRYKQVWWKGIKERNWNHSNIISKTVQQKCRKIWKTIQHEGRRPELEVHLFNLDIRFLIWKRIRQNLIISSQWKTQWFLWYKIGVGGILGLVIERNQKSHMSLMVVIRCLVEKREETRKQTTLQLGFYYMNGSGCRRVVQSQ